MINATRPFVVNEWINAKIDGVEFSGIVEVSFIMPYFVFQLSVIKEKYLVIILVFYGIKLLSVRKVVPTVTSTSPEIYLSMGGAKQLSDTRFILVPARPYVQQGCARGTVLRCTVVLAEGSYKQGGRGGASRSLRFD
jgi:hypothetical protein